jgi:xylulokinase
MLALGFDLGSSFVKASLVDSASGRILAHASSPDEEMAIDAPRPGWAEQDPAAWWRAILDVTARLSALSPVPLGDTEAIGISYQMHGLVLLDASGLPLRPSIIWCDSRATEIGREAFAALGEDACLGDFLNSPGNFTASKLRWVSQEEPAVYARARYAMLPGDYIAYKMTGEAATTISGLSEGILWDFHRHSVATQLLGYYNLSADLLPPLVPTFGEQGRLTPSAARELGLRAGTPLTYRAGDQPNNALSLNVLRPGEIAATAGTSGVVYAVSSSLASDRKSRVNGFAHVNHTRDTPRIGVLLCINGAGSANSWIRRMTGESAYADMDRRAAGVPVGARGLIVLPFGNGAERMLGNRDPGGRIYGLRFPTHGTDELFRAVQEGVAFSFVYGMEIMRSMGISPVVLRAGKANMFLSSVFCSTLASTAGVSIELFTTDGSAGAARGAAWGGKTAQADAFRGLERAGTVEPGESAAACADAYSRWRERVSAIVEHEGGA